MSIPYDTSNHNIASPQNVLSPPDRSQQQQQQAPPQQIPYVNDQEAILKYVLSQPNMAEQVLRQYGIYNVAAPMVPTQQTLQQPQVTFQTQSVPYQQPIPTQIPPQRQPIQVSFQQPVYQPQQPRMPFQPTYFSPPPQQPQQPQRWPQQSRRTLPSVIHYLPTNTDQPSPSTQQTQQFPVFSPNGSDNMPQQFLDQLNIWNLTDRNLNQTTTIDPLQQQMKTDEVENIDSLS